MNVEPLGINEYNNNSLIEQRSLVSGTWTCGEETQPLISSLSYPLRRDLFMRAPIGDEEGICNQLRLSSFAALNGGAAVVMVHALPLQVTSFNPSPHDSSSPFSATNSSRGAVGPCNCTTKSFPNAPIKELWALLMAYRPLVILWPSTAPQPFTRQHNLQVIPRMMSQELNIIYVGKWTIISAYEFINVCIVIGNYARQHIRGDRKDNPLIFGKLCWHRGCGDHVAILIIGKGQLRIEYLLNRSIDKNSMTTIVSMK